MRHSGALVNDNLSHLCVPLATIGSNATAIECNRLHSIWMSPPPNSMLPPVWHRYCTYTYTENERVFFLASPKQVNAFNILLAATIACLTLVLLLRQQPASGQLVAEKTGVPVAPSESARRVVEGVVPAGLGMQPAASAPLSINGSPDLYSCKTAIRLVESGEAFLLSLSLRNLATNAVEIDLQGSLLSIQTSHRQHDNSVVRRKNCFMLPAAVVTNPAPTYFLTNDLLQIHICKRSATL